MITPLTAVYIGGATWVASGLIRKAVKSVGAKRMPTSRLIDPHYAADIAARIPGTGLNFAMNALHWVHRTIEYRKLGTLVKFQDGQITCHACYVPEAVVASGNGNCFSQSILLASILRNKYPPERVYVALGDVMQDGGSFGHAWVTLDGVIMDPTNAFYGHDINYRSEVYFNDRYKVCLPGAEICVNHKGVKVKVPKKLEGKNGCGCFGI